MQTFRFSLVVAVACVFASPARAERLIELFQVAIDKDPQLRAAHYGASSKSKAQLGATLDYFVRAEANYEKSTNDQRIFSSDNQVYQKGRAIYGQDRWVVQAVQPILRADLIVKNQRTDLEQQKAKFEVRAAEQGLISRLVEAYLYVLAARDGIQFADAELKALGEQLKSVEARQQAGTANAAETAETGERFSQAQARQIDAKINIDDRYEGIAQIVGYRPRSVVPLGSNLPVLDVRDRDPNIWVEAAIKQNPKLLARDFDVRIAAKDIDAQLVRMAPSLEARGEYNRDQSSGSLFGGGSDVGTWRGMMQVRVPLFDSGSAIAGASGAHDRKRQVQEELEADRRGVMRSARINLEGVLGGPKRVDALRKALAYSDTALKERRGRLEAGQITTVELLDSIRNYYRVARDLAAARYEYINAYVKLKEAAGSLDEQDLAMIDSHLAGGRDR
jgi:outer membrane protein